MRSVAMICLLASVTLGLSACAGQTSSAGAVARASDAEQLTCRDGFGISHGQTPGTYVVGACGAKPDPTADGNGRRGLGGSGR